MASYTWCLTVEELRDILSQYPEDALVKIDSFGTWSTAELTIYNPKTKFRDTIMEVDN